MCVWGGGGAALKKKGIYLTTCMHMCIYLQYAFLFQNLSHIHTNRRAYLVVYIVDILDM